MAERSILWRRIDQPGHEAARVVERVAGWGLSGTAVFAHDARPCRLDYTVTCDRQWRTVAAQVTGWLGNVSVDVGVTVDAHGHWRLNDRECPGVVGCIDVDLNFSPSTNVLPIRRLQLRIGQSVPVRAAWLRFPSFALEPFDQVYSRPGATTYRYESARGFAADLEVDDFGLPLRYGDIWQAEVVG